MSYLLDKKIKRKKILNIIVLLFFIIAFFYFRNSIFNTLSFVSHNTFRPILVLKNNLSITFSNLKTAFLFKNSLLDENEYLKLKLMENNALLLNYNSVLSDNIKIKEILGRKDEKMNMLLSAVLSKPNQSPYDTFIIDVGANNGVKKGDLVFALSNVPIGYISLVYPNSSKVILFSNSGDKTEVVVTGQPTRNHPSNTGEDVFMQIVGRGGGNFEMILPRDFVLDKGSTVFLPGISSYVVAITEATISDPRDSFVKILLTSPVNIQELKFVEVKL